MEMKIKQRLVGAAMIAALAAGMAGCSKDPYRSSGRVMDDRSVTKRVKGALNDSPAYKFPYVDVRTYNGAVQLNGFVHRDEQKAMAADIARHIEGARNIINNISVIPPQEQVYGGTVDAKTSVRGTGKSQTATATTPSTNQYRNSN